MGRDRADQMLLFHAKGGERQDHRTIGRLEAERAGGGQKTDGNRLRLPRPAEDVIMIAKLNGAVLRHRAGPDELSQKCIDLSEVQQLPL